MPEARPFWEGCRRHELWLPYCTPCAAFFFYPRPFCPRCFSWGVEWRRVSGRGVIHAFAVHYRATNPLWAEDVPYVTAIVELDEGPRLFTHLVGVEPDPSRIASGLPVEVVFEDVTDEITLPKFRPAARRPGFRTEATA
jgi:uncharacterized OB-fold protein